MGRILAIVLLVVGCGSKAGGDGKPKVAVSIFPLYDVTRRIAGDRIDVVLVLPPGRSEHGYDPTPQEMARLDGAKLGIAVGLDMDTWVETVIKSGGSGKIVHVGDKVPTIPISTKMIGDDDDDDDHDHDHHDGHAEEHEHHHHEEVGSPDPHVWLDPDRMRGVVDTIAGELAAIDPAGKDAFAKNADAIKASLGKLDAAIMERSKGWSKHVIVTFHGSMTYYAKRYGVKIAAVVEPIAGKEPTAKYITEVIAAIKKGNASALFSEPQFEKAPAEMIAKEANIPLGELDPVGGVPGRDSYEALLTWDTDQLEKTLK
jgi:zinc transport system substrate-binding protein